MNRIKVFLVSTLLLMNFIAHAMDDDFEVALEKMEKVLAPWALRTKEAENYMNRAIKLDDIQIVDEEFKGIAVKTIFHPDTKMVDLQVGLLHESVEFNFFMRWLDAPIAQEKKSKKVSLKKSICNCGLQ